MDQDKHINIARNTAIISGAFCILISLMLIMNYWQMQASEPLESKAMEMLVRRLSMEPGNEELKQEIRSLDLLARKAYFTSLWQVRTGGWLLLFSSIVLVIALRIRFSIASGIEIPSDEEKNEISERMLSQKWIMAGGVILILPAVIIAFTSSDPLDRYAGDLAASEQSGTGQIEQISITDRTDPGIGAGIRPSEAAGQPASDDMIPPDEETADTGAGHGGEPSEMPSSTVVFPDEKSIMSNHNAFRGPFGNPVSEHKNLPVDWDGASGKNILWKIPVPLHAFNSPVIWEDKLFLAGAEENNRQVFCFNRHTGELIWQKTALNVPGSPAVPPKTTDDTGLSAPSLTTDGIGVYAIFGTGDVLAFDMQGNRKWARNLGVPENHYGHSSSLLSLGEKLFVQFDDMKQGRIICLNVLSGETIWDIERTSDVSWASPLLAKVSGKYQLVVSGNPIVAGYDIESGRELWSVNAMAGEVGPSPAWGGGLVFAANEYARMVAIDPVAGRQVWETRHYLPEVSSPATEGNLLFIGTTYALIACFDAKTGELLWEFDSDNMIYSSPVIADGKLWVTDTGGETYIFSLDREQNLLARSSLGEEVYTVPAFSDGKIYFRGEHHLYCIGN